MRAELFIAPTLMFCALACAQVRPPAAGPLADGATTGADTDTGSVEGGAGLATFIVYAHTSDRLFAVDPETMTVRLVGPFMRRNAVTGNLGPLVGVTDIAVDHGGRINGLTASEVLAIDGRTAECTTLSTIDGNRQLNGLSWVPIPGGETLLATAGDGTVFRLDPMTGASTTVGSLGPGLTSSGDLVSVARYGTLVTVKRFGMSGDWLATLDPATGTATPVGAIGFNNVWGIGFWKDRVFGFDQTGQFILINPDTGAGVLAQSFPDLRWWGAGVTTSVFVVP